MNDPQTALDVAARFLTRTLAAGGPAGARVVMAAADENAVADLIEVTLPCLLDGTNLTAWDRLGWRLLVPAAQAGRLRAAPAFTRLAERAAGETLEFTKPFPAGWLDAVSLAPSWRDGDTVIWLPAGTVLSDGALPALLNTPADTAALASCRSLSPLTSPSRALWLGAMA